MSTGDDSAPAAPATQPDSPFKIHTDLFIDRINSLEEAFPLSMLITQATHHTAIERFNRFLDDHGVDSGKTLEDGRPLFKIPPDRVYEFRRFEKRMRRWSFAAEVLPRSQIIALVSEFDFFLAGLIRLFFLAHPEALNASEKTLTLAKLMEFGSIGAARDHIIDKEIESVLRDSHTDQFKWLENKLNIQLRKDLPAWIPFIELTERRNLFVHANGVVSTQYLDVCKREGVDTKDLKAGDTLTVTPAYFRSAYYVIFEIGVKLGQVLWRKVVPADVEAAEKHLGGQVIFDLLLHGEYKLATNLADFGIALPNKSKNDFFRRVLVVNRAQAYKWSGQHEKCVAILDAEDWTATKDEFRLIVAVLKDDFGTATTMLPSLSNSSMLTKTSYREWPVFKEIRKDKNFQTAFESLFNEPITLLPVSQPPDESKPPEPTVH
jgi:hypothetical protein